MNIIKTENRFCPYCLEVHDISIVEEPVTTHFKGQEITYPATYEYCSRTNEYSETEQMLDTNDLSLKDAYRKQVGLLTSSEITNIRAKYGFSQADFSILLGWGEKTITRYEGHQIQTSANDEILKRLRDDPEWLMQLFEQKRNEFSLENMQKYRETIARCLTTDTDEYLRKYLLSKYAIYYGDDENCGNTALNIGKIVDVILYFSEKINDLFKVKLMKLLWYADMVSYKRYSHSMMGLAYSAEKLGAVPIGHGVLKDFHDVNCEEIETGDMTKYKFSGNSLHTSQLTKEETQILDEIIRKFGAMQTLDLVEYMHQERAYQETTEHNIISYHYAKDLSVG